MENKYQQLCEKYHYDPDSIISKVVIYEILEHQTFNRDVECVIQPIPRTKEHKTMIKRGDDENE